MKMHGRVVVVQLHLFLTLAQDGLKQENVSSPLLFSFF